MVKNPSHDPGALPPDRDGLASDRTILANERTYQAWLRTGLASAAAGLALFKLMQETFPLWILLTVASVLLLFSALFFLMAAWRYNHIHLRTAHLDIDTLPPGIARLISVLLAGCSLLVLGGLLAAASTGGL